MTPAKCYLKVPPTSSAPVQKLSKYKETPELNTIVSDKGHAPRAHTRRLVARPLVRGRGARRSSGGERAKTVALGQPRDYSHITKHSSKNVSKFKNTERIRRNEYERDKPFTPTDVYS